MMDLSVVKRITAILIGILVLDGLMIFEFAEAASNKYLPTRVTSYTKSGGKWKKDTFWDVKIKYGKKNMIKSSTDNFYGGYKAKFYSNGKYKLVYAKNMKLKFNKKGHPVSSVLKSGSTKVTHRFKTDKYGYIVEDVRKEGKNTVTQTNTLTYNGDHTLKKVTQITKVNGKLQKDDCYHYYFNDKGLMVGYKQVYYKMDLYRLFSYSYNKDGSVKAINQHKTQKYVFRYGKSKRSRTNNLSYVTAMPLFTAEGQQGIIPFRFSTNDIYSIIV